MADVVHRDPDRGSGTALGVIIGILLVLVLLIGGWWLFFRTPAVDEPNTTIIEQEQPDVDVQPAPEGDEGDTNIIVPPTDEGQETSPAP